MKLQFSLTALTFINAGMLALFLVQTHAFAGASADDQVLRGRGLEIVDADGRVRASIKLLPPSRQQDGTMSAETVLLRLVTEQGRPSVKIAASEQQSAMSLAGPSGTSNSYVQVLAGVSNSAVIVKNEDGREQRLSP